MYPYFYKSARLNKSSTITVAFFNTKVDKTLQSSIGLQAREGRPQVKKTNILCTKIRFFQNQAPKIFVITLHTLHILSHTAAPSLHKFAVPDRTRTLRRKMTTTTKLLTQQTIHLLLVKVSLSTKSVSTRYFCIRLVS